MCSRDAPEARLQAAMREGLGQLVVVQVKQFARSLHSSQVHVNEKSILLTTKRMSYNVFEVLLVP